MGSEDTCASDRSPAPIHTAATTSASHALAMQEHSGSREGFEIDDVNVQVCWLSGWGRDRGTKWEMAAVTNQLFRLRFSFALVPALWERREDAAKFFGDRRGPWREGGNNRARITLLQI